jgi:hypothetical protein
VRRDPLLAAARGIRGYWPGWPTTSGATPAEREISRLNDAIEKVVVSDTTPQHTNPLRLIDTRTWEARATGYAA